jgi:phosphonate transport system substrate-binding protein
MKGLFPVVMLIVLLSGCARDGDSAYEPRYSSSPPESDHEYVFAVHPLHNPVRLLEVYGPIMEYLNRNITGSTFRLEASRNYDEFDRKLYNREPEFALPNPYQTYNSLKHGYRVIAKMGDDHRFTGIILVRRDAGIGRVSDLKGKKVAYPARTALAATMMPKYFLQTHGLDVNRDIENVYVGSQESSIMNVYLGNVAAGATWPLPWEAFQKEHPDRARELVVQWETEPLINNGVVVRDDVPESLAGEVARLLADLHSTEEGRAMLARIPLSRFEVADNRRYRVIGDFLRQFKLAVGPIGEQKKQEGAQ